MANGRTAIVASVDMDAEDADASDVAEKRTPTFKMDWYLQFFKQSKKDPCKHKCKDCNVEKSADASSAANLKRHLTTGKKCKDCYVHWAAMKDAEKDKRKQHLTLTANSFKPKSQREWIPSAGGRSMAGWKS